MNIKQQFSDLIAEHTSEEFSEQEVEKMLGEFLMVSNAYFMAAAAGELSGEDSETLKKLIDDKDLGGAMKLIELKLETSKLEEIYKKTIEPLAEGYVKEVLEK